MHIYNLSYGLVEEIELHLLKPSPYNVREGSGEPIEELMASIKEKGLLHPLVVRPKDGYFEIICGNRRFEALRKLRWKRAPVRIIEVDDRTAFELALVENLQRKSLNPIEEAKAFKAYVERVGWGGVSELARRIGKSQEYVSKRLSLLNLPKEVQELIAEGAVSPSLASELVGLDRESQVALSLEAKKGLVKVRDVREIKRRIREEKEENPWDLSTDGVKALERCIMALRVSLIRMSSALEKVERNSLLWIILMEERDRLSKQIDRLIRMKLKIKKKGNKINRLL